MQFSLLLVLLTITLCRSESSSCPSKEDISPCTCHIGLYGKLWVSCEGITSRAQLENIVDAMEDFKLTSFFLTNSNIGVLPSKLFQDIDIEYLTILFTNLTSLSEGLNRPPFVGLEHSLEALEIHDGFIDDQYPLTRLSLAHLKKLTILQLEGNKMPIIGNDWFESGPYGLHELYLLDTSTKRVGNHAFLALKELRKFSLTGGSVSVVLRSMFPMPALNLEVIDLSDNQIQTLPQDLFSKMPSLSEIFLENNDLKSLDEVVFSLIWSQLSYAFFDGNPLNCNEQMKWIFKYRLPESLQGHCASPRGLNQRSLKNLTLADFE